MNGSGLDLIVNEFNLKEANYKKPRLLVHLNIMEGKPITKTFQTNLIHESSLIFDLNHAKIFRILYFSTSSTKAAFLASVEAEWDAQVGRAIQLFGKDAIVGLDSHRHTHAYQQLNRISRRLLEKYDLSFLRPTSEKYYLKSYFDLFHISYYIGLLRNTYLRLVSLGIRRDSLVQPVTGIIYSGHMTKGSALKGVLANISKIDHKVETEGVLSIFHPGVANAQEVIDFPPQFKKWYLSKNRRIEFQAVIEISKIGKITP
jgi:hypothetical protein